jgi:hypothetical protein
MRAFILPLLAGLLPIPAPCRASPLCTCLEETSLEQARASADAVALLRAVAIDPVQHVERFGDRPFTFAVRRATFVVEARWKGEVGDTLQVVGWSSCDAAFIVGQRYLVFADRLGTAGNANWAVSHCGRSALAESAAGDLATLGPPIGRRHR